MIEYFADLIQGSDEWLAARRGLLTASEMNLIVTPTLKIASNDKERSHLYELLAQRITGYVEPHYMSDDMLRGYDDELRAVELYSEHYAPVQNMGFVTNDRWGFKIGWSPDGLVGEDGFIECKSRRQKFQTRTMIENVLTGTIPVDYWLQIQTAFLVSERKWGDFISYSGGQPMITIRCWPDETTMAAIVDASCDFERRVREKSEQYAAALASGDARLIPTERAVEQEITI